MAEVNEEILEQYLKITKRWFTVIDIPFAVPHNYSNIDVLGYDPTTGKYYDFEVKYRSAYSLTNNGKDIFYLVEQFTKFKDLREKALSDFIGTQSTVKIIVTTYKMLGKSLKKRKSMESDFNKAMTAAGFNSQIWYFDEIIPQLVSKVNTRGRYNTQLLQTIRMLKAYNIT